jgi:arginine repressor
MDRLAQAERHVEVGERNIARQREIVAELEQDGHDATQTHAILSVFEQRRHCT